MRMRVRFFIALCCMLLAGPAFAGADDEVRALYQRFAAAQNARDAKAIAAQLLQSQTFLWVSDGKSIWGTEATIERMTSFQAAEVWRVEPRLGEAKVIPVGADAAYLHMPLDLVIGSKEKPDRLAFLVSILCVKAGTDWKIAALFTTTAKPEK